MRLRLLLFSCLIGISLNGQVLPPDFTCIDNDTLRWAPTPNSCGAFESYAIYGSQDSAGPYLLLANITDANQTSWFHDAAGNDTWHYFLESIHVCPGQPTLTSDTLDNLVPGIAPLLAADVLDNRVHLSWRPSTSPEVVGYLVNRQTIQGIQIIDTVYSGTTYTDDNAPLTDGPEQYFILAIDACGNASLVDVIHATVYLQHQPPSGCQRDIELIWTDYVGWAEGVDTYEISVSIGGGPMMTIDQLPGNQTSYAFSDTEDDQDYCFRVVAMRADGTSAGSNTTCLSTVIVPPLRQLQLLQVTLTDDGVEQTYYVDTDAAIAALDIYRDGQPVAWDGGAPLMPTQPIQVTTDATLDLTTGPHSYLLEGVDQCDVQLSTPALSTLYLTVQSNGGSNRLSWTPYGNAQVLPHTYEIYRNGVWLDQVDASTNSFTDLIDVKDPDQVRACYTITALADVSLPDSTNFASVSRSNEACIQQQAAVYVPNTFAPEGVNHAFRPYLEFGTPDAYELRIFDRWGALVFESQDVNKGWDGRIGGERAAMGVYVWSIILKQGDIERRESGDVILMR